MDPRVSIIDTRLNGIENILVFASSKGGVGKSVCAATTALLLARQGLRVGLLDLDFHGASAHIIVDAPIMLPEESGGILPHQAAFGLGFMSIASFTGEKPAPLRGEEISNALIELLTITLWGKRDYLIIDMPPGIGDELLDVIRLIKKAETVVISTPSAITEKVVQRLLLFLTELRIPVRGIIENMIRENDRVGKNGREPTGERFPASKRGRLAYYPDLEASLGKPDRLVKTEFAVHLQSIVAAMLEQ